MPVTLKKQALDGKSSIPEIIQSFLELMTTYPEAIQLHRYKIKDTKATFLWKYLK
jgi:hypothetical protein